MPTVAVYIPQEIYDHLAVIGHQKGKPVSRLIRNIVEKALALNGGDGNDGVQVG